MKTKVALRLIEDELELAQSNHKPFSSCHEGFAVILEEVDELWEEVKANNGNTHRGVSEAVQIGAMAFRYLIDLCEQEEAEKHEEKVKDYTTKSKLLGDSAYYTGIGGYSG